MRVGLLIYGSLETLSGGYLYDRLLVDYLRKQGDQVEVIQLPWRNYPWHLFDNISTSLTQRLLSLDVDVLIQDELNHPSLAWLNHQIKNKIDYPIISLVHHQRSSEVHPKWLQPVYRRVETRYLESVDGFIFNSQTTRQTVEELIGTVGRCVVAHPGGDRLNVVLSEEDIRARATQAGPLRIVFLANITVRKQLHVLFDGLAILEPNQWRLTVIGGEGAEPAYARRIREQVRDCGWDENVQFLGTLQKDSLARELRNQDILVVPSSYEGFGIVYLEGMGFGLPAIATTAGAAQEIIRDGETGFLIPPGDAEALAKHLQTLWMDRERLLAMSLAAREHFSHASTWNDMTEKVRRFLVEVVG